MPNYVLPSRLLFVVNTGWFFLSHRLPIARALQAHGVEVHLAAPNGADLVDVEAHGIHVHPILLSRSGMNPVTELWSIVGLTQLYRQVKPDLVHHVTPKPVLYGSIAAQLARVPAVVNAVSGLGYAFVGSDLRAQAIRAAASGLYRLAFRHPNIQTVFQNPTDQAVLDSIVPGLRGRSTLIRGSGVALDQFRPSPSPEGRVTVLLAARMLRNKGVYDFAAAARRLQASMTEPPRMVLVGEPDVGNPTSVSASDLMEWSSEGLVEWWGKRSDMADVLRKAHIFCLPSHGGEGVPKAILEAMASGRPVVATDVPGCRDAVEDAVTGLIVPPRNPERLAQAIATLSGDPRLRASMAQAARDRAEALYSVEIVVQDHLSIYQRLVTGNKSAPLSSHS